MEEIEWLGVLGQLSRSKVGIPGYVLIAGAIQDGSGREVGSRGWLTHVGDVS